MLTGYCKNLSHRGLVQSCATVPRFNRRKAPAFLRLYLDVCRRIENSPQSHTIGSLGSVGRRTIENPSSRVSSQLNRTTPTPLLTGNWRCTHSIYPRTSSCFFFLLCSLLKPFFFGSSENSVHTYHAHTSWHYHNSPRRGIF